MSGKEGAQCRVMLRHCLAIIVRKEGCQGDPGDFWMYESGYLLFQGLLSANNVCWWSSAIQGATRSLTYKGYVSPGALLVTSEPCALEILRGAWSRRVLQPPAGYQIVGVEDIENCLVAPVNQTQWTPLTEAVCAVVLRLSSQGRPAGLESIREALILAFPHVSPPSERTLYDTLAQLTGERKLYHTSKGYFIVTPERRRSRSHSRGRRRPDDPPGSKGLLMSTEEALVLVHGEMATIRDGDVTHQCIQTNLADVICGGNASDKILMPRNLKRRSASFPAQRSPDRRGSFRLWGSTRRLRRSASTRTLARHCTDSSSSTEYPNSTDSFPSSKKASLLSRLFRRSKRSQCQINSFSAQFPPTEWFNSKAIHLHNVGTQTTLAENDSAISIPYYFDSEVGSARSATLPRRHRRQFSTDSNGVTSCVDSREHSPTLGRITRSSSTLRSTYQKALANTRKISRSSLSPKEKEDASVESLKTSQTAATFPETTTCTLGKSSDGAMVKKISVNVDNSGPSSIESHKSSKTGSSATSGPSSIESHQTVINRPPSPLTRPSHQRVLASSKVKPPIKHSNSFTLQVTTNNQGATTSQNNSSTTTTINGGSTANTKIYVQNSPVRSVITFENAQTPNVNPNVVIINGQNEQTVEESNKGPKNTNSSLNNSKDKEETEMNNRKMSLQLPTKDSLSYRNYLKKPDVGGFTRNSFASSPPSPTKSCENVCAKLELPILEKNILGSEPNISHKEQDYGGKKMRDQQFPSLSDLSFNFTSLAAQKILNGVSINSIDTLVELNVAAGEKQNNCDVVHTDFGLV